MSKPKLVPSSGRSYQVAVLLLAPLISALSKDEFEEVVALVRESTGSSLMEAYNNFSTANAVMATAALQTRFANEPGMSEASEVTFVSSMYLDNNIIMPPQNAKYENSWLEKYFPDIADGMDAVGDALQNIILAEDNSLDASAPPLLTSDNNPMYIRALFEVLDNTFKSVDSGVDLSSGVREQRSGSGIGSSIAEGVKKMIL